MSDNPAMERAEIWRPASEAPYGINSSRIGTFLVASPVLLYIFFNGITFGTYDQTSKKWYLLVDGKRIEHAITHWRELPPAPQIAPPYEKVKDQVEALRALLKR